MSAAFRTRGMTAPDQTLPEPLANALASLPWPVNIALVYAIGAALVLLLAHVLDRLVVDPYFERIERETQTGKYRPPSEAEFESAAEHWHKPPVQAWGDEPREVGK